MQAGGHVDHPRVAAFDTGSLQKWQQRPGQVKGAEIVGPPVYLEAILGQRGFLSWRKGLPVDARVVDQDMKLPLVSVAVPGAEGVDAVRVGEIQCVRREVVRVGAAVAQVVFQRRFHQDHIADTRRHDRRAPAREDPRGFVSDRTGRRPGHDHVTSRHIDRCRHRLGQEHPYQVCGGLDDWIGHIQACQGRRVLVLG